MSRLRWVFLQLSRKLWIRAGLIGLLGVLAALLAAFAQRYIPAPADDLVSSEVLSNILNVLATSMLTVTTFSLSVMVSAYSTATSTVTPRATTLLIQDSVTQNVLSTFLGSFLFAMVGIVVMGAGAYGRQGRVVLFFFTVVVIFLIVIAMLQWIYHLTWLGRVSETTQRVETATMNALQERIDLPFLGANPILDPSEIPADAVSVVTSEVGYVQFIDINALHDIAQAGNLHLYVMALPGTFAYEGAPLVRFVPNPVRDEEQHRQVMGQICAAIEVGHLRSFDQDPRFGLAVLAEIAARALSPAINDSGTAIDVIGRAARILSAWGSRPRHPDDEVVKHPRIHVPTLRDDDMFEDVFGPIARDGAGRLEVVLRLTKTLRALGQIGDSEFRTAAAHFERVALDFAATGLERPDDRNRVQRELGLPA